jgi:1-aminocyclopropane-1-carboxylate deaminase
MDSVEHRWLQALPEWPRAALATLPTPLHPLTRLTRALDGPEIWIKRDDLTGLVGGGNKTRKLEFVVGDALRTGADTLVTVGAVQSNHTRQTAAAAARVGLDCVLLHNNWVPNGGAFYRAVGNVLLSHVLGATLYWDATERAVGDHGQLDSLVQHLAESGRVPYLIPCGASDLRVGGLGYVACAAEIVAQAEDLGIRLDHVLHCTGSSSTQAGLLAGFAAMGTAIVVLGISDDDEIETKRERILRLANATLAELGAATRISAGEVHVMAADPSPYGVAGADTLDAIRLLARTEGLLADPVYEGKAMRGLVSLVERGDLRSGQRVLLVHLGGNPAVHAYAAQLGQVEMIDAPLAADGSTDGEWSELSARDVARQKQPGAVVERRSAAAG